VVARGPDIVQPAAVEIDTPPGIGFPAPAKKRKRRQSLRTLLVPISVDQATTLTATATVAAGGRRLAYRSVQRAFAGQATSNLRFTLSKRQAKRLAAALERRRRIVRVTVKAKDQSGNETITATRVTLGKR
jgi:hypothetical protein